MKKNVLSVMLALTLAASNLTACGGGREAAAQKPAAGAPQGQEAEALEAAAGQMESQPPNTAGKEQDRVEMKDLMGNTVSVPEPRLLNHLIITSWKGAFGAAVMLGQLDKVSGMCDTSKYAWLRHTYPEIGDIPDYGSFDKVNMEELLKADPDAVISPSKSEKTNEKMKGLGLTVLEDGVNIDDPKDVFRQSYSEIDLVAQLTGSTDVAERYYKWADGLFGLVSDRVKDIPENERVRVLPIRDGLTQVYGNNCLWGHVEEMAGGVNVSADSTVGTGKFYADVDGEKIVEYNPTFIFQINQKGGFPGETADSYLNWSSDKRYKDIPALVNGDVYLIPSGITQWCSDIEAPLGVLWMAKVMYPDKFRDIDVKKYGADFYAEFLGCHLTEADWKIMAPQFKGANSNGLTE